MKDIEEYAYQEIKVDSVNLEIRKTGAKTPIIFKYELRFAFGNHLKEEIS
jgi:hypothetical protein